VEHEVRIPVAGGLVVGGDLTVPAAASGLVVFCHGSGSSRHSERNRAVAEHLRTTGLATLLMDLLTLDEEALDVRTGALRFDIGLLAGRVADATTWIDTRPETAAMRLGYFGASTGAAAALTAAARNPARVHAIVSRGGRPDLAENALTRVRAPTLLIVGGRDDHVIDLNRHAAQALSVEHRLEIIPGATHLFEEPGALDKVAQLARAWFVSHLRSPKPSP